jgi:ABC-type nitrate/sulfonate/bicarbonate transport system substrate-binding protein
VSLTPLATVKDGVDASSFNFDDVKLQRLTDVAEAQVAQYLRTDLVTAFPGGLPFDVEQAVIELVRSLYDGADDESDNPRLPKLVRQLLAPHRNFT